MRQQRRATSQRAVRASVRPVEDAGTLRCMQPMLTETEPPQCSITGEEIMPSSPLCAKRGKSLASHVEDRVELDETRR